MAGNREGALEAHHLVTKGVCHFLNDLTAAEGFVPAIEDVFPAHLLRQTQEFLGSQAFVDLIGLAALQQGKEIASALEVSHIQVREAFRQLEAFGSRGTASLLRRANERHAQKKCRELICLRGLLEVGVLRDAVSLLDETAMNRAWALLIQMDTLTSDASIKELHR